MYRLFRGELLSVEDIGCKDVELDGTRYVVLKDRFPPMWTINWCSILIIIIVQSSSITMLVEATLDVDLKPLKTFTIPFLKNLFKGW